MEDKIEFLEMDGFSIIIFFILFLFRVLICLNIKMLGLFVKLLQIFHFRIV